MAGSALGIALHYWSTRMPLYFTILESILIVPGGFVLLMLDPARAEWSVPSVLQPGYMLKTEKKVIHPLSLASRITSWPGTAGESLFSFFQPFSSAVITAL